MKNLYLDGHLTEKALQALLDGALDDAQSLEFAEHIGRCDYCAGRLADCAEQSPIQAPRGMTELSMDAIQRDVHRRKREYYRFCARVAACAVVAIGLLTAGMFYPRQKVVAAPVEPPKYEVAAPPEWKDPAPPKEGTLLNDIENFFKNLPNIFHNTEEKEND